MLLTWIGLLTCLTTWWVSCTRLIGLASLGSSRMNLLFFTWVMSLYSCALVDSPDVIVPSTALFVVRLRSLPIVPNRLRLTRSSVKFGLVGVLVFSRVVLTVTASLWWPNMLASGLASVRVLVVICVLLS